jgi:hypothetical protein
MQIQNSSTAFDSGIACVETLEVQADVACAAVACPVMLGNVTGLKSKMVIPPNMGRVKQRGGGSSR